MVGSVSGDQRRCLRAIVGPAMSLCTSPWPPNYLRAKSARSRQPRMSQASALLAVTPWRAVDGLAPANLCLT